MTIESIDCVIGFGTKPRLKYAMHSLFDKLGPDASVRDQGGAELVIQSGNGATIRIHPKEARLTFSYGDQGEQISSPDGLSDLAMGVAQESYNLVFEDVLSLVDYEWTGVIAELVLDRTEDLGASFQNMIFEKIARLDWSDRKVATVNFELGYQYEQVYRNYRLVELNTYKFSRPPAGTFLSITDEFLLSKGLGLRIDTNTKPANPKGEPLDDLKMTALDLGPSLRSILEELSMEDYL